MNGVVARFESYLLRRSKQLVGRLAAQHNRLSIAAHHAAGHVVASVMRGGGELASITIEASKDYLGHTQAHAKIVDATFISFAGPWAEARALWPGADLPGQDLDGYRFADYLEVAWALNYGGEADDDAAAEPGICREEWFSKWVSKREAEWSCELEDVWPVITTVARLLVDDRHVDHATIEELLDRHWEFESAVFQADDE